MKKIVLLPLLMLCMSTAYGQGPKAKEVHIETMKAVGDGCPKGSFETIVTPSNAGSTSADYFQISYDKFSAKNGKGVSRRERSKYCVLNLNVTFPKGYRFKFVHSQFDGYAELEAGLTGEFETIYREPGKSKVKTFSKMNGPWEGDFSLDETGAMTDGFYSGCSGSSLISIQSTIRIRGDRKLNGVLTRDVQSGALDQKYRLKWQRC